MCVAMSEMNEWDLRGGNTILTGSSDGVVRMWSLQFVQVPDESAKQKPADATTTTTSTSLTDGDSGGKGNVNEKEKKQEDVQNLNSVHSRFKGSLVVLVGHIFCIKFCFNALQFETVLNGYRFRFWLRFLQ